MTSDAPAEYPGAQDGGPGAQSGPGRGPSPGRAGGPVRAGPGAQSGPGGSLRRAWSRRGAQWLSQSASSLGHVTARLTSGELELLP
jgi:hypothetical protein